MCQVDTAHGPVVASLHAVLLVSASLPPERCARVRSEAAGDEAALQRELDREIEVLQPEPEPKPQPEPNPSPNPNPSLNPNPNPNQGAVAARALLERCQRRQACLHQPARGRQGAPLRLARARSADVQGGNAEGHGAGDAPGSRMQFPGETRCQTAQAASDRSTEPRASTPVFSVCVRHYTV